MENNQSQNKQTELVLTKYAILPVAVLIHKQSSVKCSINCNICKESITKQTPAKIEDNQKI